MLKRLKLIYSARWSSPTLYFTRLIMSRRASSSSPPSSPRPSKKQKMDTHLTSESFRNGVMLAPMVRSGACASPSETWALCTNC